MQSLAQGGEAWRLTGDGTGDVGAVAVAIGGGGVDSAAKNVSRGLPERRGQ